MGEIKEVGTNGNGKAEVPKEAMDIIAGLKLMGDLDGVEFPLSRIEIMMTVFEDAASSEATPFDAETITEGVQWVTKTLDEIRHTLAAQDHLIWTLRRLVDTPIESETFEAEEYTLDALRSLTNLFLYSHSSYSKSTDAKALKAWAISNGYDYELVKDFLGSLPVSMAKARGEEVPESVKKLDGFMATISKKNGFSQPKA